MDRVRDAIYSFSAFTTNAVAFLLTMVWIELTWIGILGTATLLRHEYCTYYARAAPPASAHLGMSTFRKAAILAILSGPVLCFLWTARDNRHRRWFRVLKGLLLMQPILMLTMGAIVAVEVTYNPWVVKVRRVWEVLNE